MNRNQWMVVALGVGGVVLLSRRGAKHGASQSGVGGVFRALGLPIETTGIPHVTPHGDFGAARQGPPVHTHQGVDLQARAGSHVLAIADGKIVDTAPGLGKVVRKLELATPASWTDGGRKVRWVVYADLGEALVHAGDVVRRGDAVALVDKPGFVHFAVKDLVGNREVFFDPAQAGFSYVPSSSALVS